MTSSLVVAGVCGLVVIGAGGLMTEIGPWYRALRKPPWQPPDWVFGPAWTLILALAAWSAARGWDAGDPGQRRIMVVLFVINAFFQLLWSPLFFKLRRPDWALVEVVFLWLSILALVIWLAPISTLSAWLLAPYFGWVTFATFLNLRIVRLNPVP
jgi:tryptophan-rich sensory protein